MTETHLPVHVAIVCDGNRRWAQQQGMKVFLGHQKAIDEVIEPLVDRAEQRGIKFLTFWVFSTENWQRPESEVSYLLELFRQAFDRQVQRLHEKNVRVVTIGDLSKFPEDIQTRIRRGKSLTQDNTGITVIFALNYGGRDEMLRAINTLVKQQLAESKNDQSTDRDITKEEFAQYLDTTGIPDPDFIIRTSGEQRLSGFLLWQAEYAELAFPAFHFPEFTPEKFDQLLAEYAHRRRRYGK